jgi:hypothetical protein
MLANACEGILAAFDWRVAVMVVLELCELGPAVDAMLVQVCDRMGDTLLEERHSWAVVPRKAAGLGGGAIQKVR